EHVERFRRRDVEKATEPIRTALARWADRHADELALARPELPEELSDRMQEGCEPLLAIADALGYGDEARDALVLVLGAERVDSQERAALQLLRDIRGEFVAQGTTAFHTEQLLNSLAFAEGDWVNWYGRGLDARGLAGMLRPYGIQPRSVRVGDRAAKGYHRD